MRSRQPAGCQRYKTGRGWLAAPGVFQFRRFGTFGLDRTGVVNVDDRSRDFDSWNARDVHAYSRTLDLG